MPTYNRIELKGSARYEEGFAVAALTPGHVIEVISTGKVQKQSVRGVDNAFLIAIEMPLNQGKTIDDAYAANDVVAYLNAQPGDEVYAFISAGENVVKGDRLVFTGDGTLEKISSTYKAKAVAMENLNLSASAAVDTRLPVRVL